MVPDTLERVPEIEDTPPSTHSKGCVVPQTAHNIWD